MCNVMRMDDEHLAASAQTVGQVFLRANSTMPTLILHNSQQVLCHLVFFNMWVVPHDLSSDAANGGFSAPTRSHKVRARLRNKEEWLSIDNGSVTAMMAA